MTDRTQRVCARIEAAWCRESAMTPETWSEDVPSRDQCAVTAALLFEELGLPVVRGQAFLPDGRVDSHYWNAGIDLTRGQYPAGTRVVPREGPQGAEAYAYLMLNPDLVHRLGVLRARYEVAAAEPDETLGM